MSKHKNQHFVPSSYLAAWCDPATPEGHEPYVWRFTKDGSRSRNKAPDNIFSETETYTIILPDGKRDLRLEHGLSTVESNFVRLRDGPLRERKELNTDDTRWLLIFVAAMHARTVAMRDHQSRQWGGVLEMMDDLDASFRSMTPDERKRAAAMPTLKGHGPSLTHKQVRVMAAQPLQTIMLPMIAAEAEHYARMAVRVFVTDTSPGFITSDDPCIWFDANAVRGSPMVMTPNLESPSVEVTLPLSPTELLLITNHPELSGWRRISPAVVEHLNRRTRCLCDEYFVVNRNFSDPAWFDVGRLMEPYRRRNQGS